ELKEQLEELRKLKALTKKSIPLIPEDPYFETRLMAQIDKKNTGSFKVKKYVPVFSFVLLAAFLMVFLKAKPDFFNNVFDLQKNKIASLYTQNLKPLLFASRLSNDEIFNFAMYKQLPLDNNDKQYLLLGYSPEGKEYFEVKSGNIKEGGMDLDKFVTALNLNNNQKKVVDSILNSYSTRLQTEVLINDKNALAINPNLWNYNKVIAADIFRYAASINKSVLNKILPVSVSYYDNPKVVAAINKIKSDDNADYIFFTPDSIFTSKVDKEKIKRDLQKMKIELRKGLQEVNINLPKEIRLNIDQTIKSLKKEKTWAHDFKVNFDSNECRVEIPQIVIPQFDMPELDKLDERLNEVFNNLKNMDIKIEKFDDNQIRMKYRMGDSSYEYKGNIPNIDSIMKDARKHNKGNYKIDGDSLKIVIKELQDSLKLNFNLPEFKEQMKYFQKQMQQFQEQMKNLDTDGIKKRIKKPKEPVEI
ncbi:MAG: hypothetical protein Q8903_07565, partial [Bacteroidota bacterium]|nr:hypothetical protein [Bacteroidota bacterium]